jgi:DNA-binding transcriptional ArsR family regulator
MSVGMRQDQRLAIFGRMRMAEWIEMPEREFAREIETLEKDGLFRKLYEGAGPRPGAIRRQRWPRGRFAGMSELNEQITAGKGERVKVEERLEDRADIIKTIEALGQEAFERYFLYAEEAVPLAEIAKRTKISETEVRAINDFLVEVGAEAEFSTLPKGPQGSGSYCVARLAIEDDEPAFEFFSPHWARGLYQIRYDQIEEMKTAAELSAEDVKKLPGLLKRLETVNLRQSTMFRILETLCKVQGAYLQTKREDAKKPISLRMLARRLDLAPSTVSRALSERSVKLPWGKEAPLIELLPGRRRQLRLILGRWLAEDATPTDAVLTGRLKQDYGIAVSRRTVNAVRHELLKPAAATPRR